MSKIRQSTRLHTPVPLPATQPGGPGAVTNASQPTVRLETVAAAPGIYHDDWKHKDA
jgi:hypothetical protein